MAGASGVTVGAVWLNVLPSMKGFGSQLTDQARRAGRPAGEQAGSSVAGGMTRGLRQFAATATDYGRRAGQAVGRGFSTAAAGGAAMLSRFQAGFRGLNSETVAAAGRLGRLGQVTRTALDPALRPVQNLVAGFRDSSAAASAFTGRLGSIGGAARSAFNVAAAPVQNFLSGFRDSNAAASAFTGRLGSLGGVARSTFTQVGSVASSALRTAAAPVQNLVAGFRSSSAAASALTGRMGSLGGQIRSAFSSAGAGMRGFAQQVRTESDAIASSITTGIGGSLRGIAGTAAGLAAAVGISAVGVSAVSAAANIQNVELTLSGLYGSAEAATDMMGRLQNLSRNSPIDYSAYAQASTQLAYMGLEGAQAEGVLRNVGAAITAAGGSSEQMGRASSAMLQIVNSGRVYAAQLSQISDAGIPIFSGLAAHFDTNIENVRTMVTEGKVSIEDVMSVMENATGDTFQSMLAASEQVSGSMSNQWAIFRDNFVTGLGQMIAPLTTSVGPAIGELGRVVGDGLARVPSLLAEIGQTWWFQALIGGLRAIWDFVQPVVTALAGMAVAVARPAFGIFAGVLGGIGTALSVVMPYLRPLQPVIIGIAAAMAIAKGASLAYSLALRGVATAKALATLATRGFNVVLKANPIVRVVSLLFGLAAAVVWAYQNFEWFRDVVDGAWRLISDGALWLWNSVLSPVFSAIGAAATWLWVNAIQPAAAGIAAAWSAISAGALWLWNSVLKPVFSFISTAVQILIAVIFTVLVTPLILGWKMIAAGATWLWQSVLQPVFLTLGAFIGWVWTALLRPAFDALVGFWRNTIAPAATFLWVGVIQPAFRSIGLFVQWVWTTLLKPALDALVWLWRNVVAPAAMWLWNTVLAPAFRGIGAVVQWAWTYLIKPALDALVWVWRNVIAPAAMWLWQNVIKPAWDGIGSLISWVWNNVIRPAFDALKQGLQWVGDKFDQTVGWIRDIWNKLRGYLAAPINFLIGTVWNEGIRPAWNKVAELLPGVEPIAPLPLIREARTGGRLDSRGMIRGRGTGTSDSVLAKVAETDEVLAVSNKEFVMNAKATRRWLPELVAMNGGARVGDRANERRGARGLAGGGPVNWRDLWNVVKGQFPTARLTSALRRGDTGHHGAGKAIDFGGPRPMDMPFMLRANQWLAQNYGGSNELIHTQPGAVNLKYGRPHSYNAAVRGDHRDHVHWANLGGGNDAGGWFSTVTSYFRDKVAELFTKVTDPLLGKIREFTGAPPPRWRQVPGDLATLMRDKLQEWLFSRADEEDNAAGGAGVDITGITGPVVEQVREVARRFGWGDGPEWSAILDLVQRESSWKLRNPNPRSSADGLFQKMQSLHGPVEPTAAGQANWGLNYIRGRYGSPTKAIAFHNRMGHYDQGGWLQPGQTSVWNGTSKPEAVFTAEQWEVLKGNIRGGDGASGERHVHFHGVRTPEEADMVAQRLEFHQRTAAF